MRLLALDTETTGLESENGHRIIEIGCVEVVNRRLTRNNLHFYLNPEREIDEGATRVHGMTWDDLRDKPKFVDVAEQFLSFCQGAEIVIHNANFDLGFLDAELARLDRGSFRTYCRGVTDSLALARELYPGKRNSLDALCDRLMVPNQHRTLHGALLDAELLAEVYLSMTRGQGSIEIEAPLEALGTQSGTADDQAWPPPRLLVRQPTPAEIQAHDAMLDIMAKQTRMTPLWRELAATDAAPSSG